jgi:hypothetical protein
MEKNMLDRFQEINKEKKLKLVFQLTDRGFASEINNMLSAILYCLLHDLEFILYSRSWNAFYEKGWQDYFLPFCKENKSLLFYRSSAFSLEGKSKLMDSFQKKIDKSHLMAHDLWPNFISENFLKTNFTIPKIDLQGDIFLAKKTILEMIYRYSAEMQDTILSHEPEMNSFKPYISVHVRRGDKVAPNTGETNKTELGDYVDRISKNAPHLKNVFIATDDYSVVDEFNRLVTNNWNVLSFCDIDNKGYDARAFNKIKKNNKKQHIIGLLKDIHYLKEGEYFFGTYSSNIGRLIALFKGRKNCFSLDIPEWFPK